ncbi:MAG: hypothetical protein AB8B74_08870 [Crocinitomicaceae bacterium]
MKLLVTILLFCSVLANSQSLQGEVQAGYNRIGVFLNPTIGINFKSHIFSFGTRVYGYNLFFESNRFGPQLGYQYKFNTEKNRVYFFPSLSYSMYREQKSNSSLLLSEINLKYGMGLNINNRLSFVNAVGMGLVLSNSNLFNELIIIKNAYPSFEISLGLVYSFNNTDRQ